MPHPPRPAPRALAALLALAPVLAPALGAQSPAAARAGTYVCVTGALANVRLDGPVSREPVSIPDQAYARSAYDPPLRFTLRPNGTYANTTLGERYASDPKWNGRYTTTGGQVRLYSSSGLLHTFVARAGTDGTPMLLEVTAPEDRYRAFACRRVDGAPAAGGAPRVTKDAPAAAARRDPYNPYGSTGGFVTVNYATDLPLDAYRARVFRFTLVPAAGGAPVVFERTGAALRSPPRPAERLPLDSTYVLPHVPPGAYRVSAALVEPGGAPRPLRVHASAWDPPAAEATLTVAKVASYDLNVRDPE